MQIVRATSKRETVHDSSTAVRERDDVMNLQEAALGAAALGADERALTAIAGPHLTLHRGRYVSRARRRGA
jgi:hypothetical protein